MDKVRQDIESLHEDLKKIDEREGETPEAVKKMLASTHNALEKFDDEPHRDTFREQLEEDLILFEADHPNLMRRMRAIITGLTNAGI